MTFFILSDIILLTQYTTDNSDYVRKNNNWYRAFIISSATLTGPNVAGPAMFLTTGISGARPGAVALVQWTPYGVFSGTASAIIVTSMHFTTNGTTPNSSSPQLGGQGMRAYAPGAGAVVSASGGTISTTIAASGQLNVGIYLSTHNVYGADQGTLTISVNNA